MKAVIEVEEAVFRVGNGQTQDAKYENLATLLCIVSDHHLPPVVSEPSRY